MARDDDKPRVWPWLVGGGILAVLATVVGSVIYGYRKAAANETTIGAVKQDEEPQPETTIGAVEQDKQPQIP